MQVWWKINAMHKWDVFDNNDVIDPDLGLINVTLYDEHNGTGSVVVFDKFSD